MRETRLQYNAVQVATQPLLVLAALDQQTPVLSVFIHLRIHVVGIERPHGDL
jgi:hypothetical protein